MMDFQDWRESFESAEDRESFDQWLREIEAQEHVDFVTVHEVRGVSNYTDCGRPEGSPYEGQD